MKTNKNLLNSMDSIILDKDLFPDTAIVDTTDPILIYDQVIIPAKYINIDGQVAKHPVLFIATIKRGQIIIISASPDVKLVKKIPKGTKLYLITPYYKHTSSGRNAE